MSDEEAVAPNPIEVERREFSESYVSLHTERLYAWWQTDAPETVRMEDMKSRCVLVAPRAELIALVEKLKEDA